MFETPFESLLERDNVQATWFWTHSKSVGPYDEYEVFDVVFTRDTDTHSVTGEFERRTLYVTGIGGSVVASMRNNSGQKIEPNTIDTLAQVMRDAFEAGDTDSFEEWADKHRDNAPVPLSDSAPRKLFMPETDPHKVAEYAFAESIKEHEEYARLRTMDMQVRRWLGSDYHAYIHAAEKFLAGDDSEDDN